MLSQKVGLIVWQLSTREWLGHLHSLINTYTMSAKIIIKHLWTVYAIIRLLLWSCFGVKVLWYQAFQEWSCSVVKLFCSEAHLAWTVLEWSCSVARLFCSAAVLEWSSSGVKPTWNETYNCLKSAAPVNSCSFRNTVLTAPAV